jgi:predicted nucleic acid-binding protein
VAGGLILETTFLVDLERELAGGTTGRAQKLLDSHAADPLFITFTTAAELAAALAPRERYRWERMVSPFTVLPATTDVCWEYGKAFRYLRANRLLIGANDLWIAATALAFGKALVTRNAREFERVPGLEVVRY